jgi:Ca2+-transporting ATPase
LYRNPTAEAALEEFVSREPGIRRVAASARTGTILVVFDPSRDLDTIATLLERIPYPNPASTPHPTLPRQTRAQYQPPVTDAPLEQTRQPWHMSDSGAVMEFLGVDRKTGLSVAGAADRLKKYGPNVLPRGTARSTWAILLSQFESLPVVLLLGSAVLSITTGGLTDAVFIVAVIALNATIGTLTERNSERLITTLTEIGQPPAIVVREGVVREIPSEEVVPGDLLVLTRGSYVPVDGRLLEAVHLTVDESVLTGESVAATKATATLHIDALPLGDRPNMVFRGTVVTGGSGLAIVVRHGDAHRDGQDPTLDGIRRAAGNTHSAPDVSTRPATGPGSFWCLWTGVCSGHASRDRCSRDAEDPLFRWLWPRSPKAFLRWRPQAWPCAAAMSWCVWTQWKRWVPFR